MCLSTNLYFDNGDTVNKVRLDRIILCGRVPVEVSVGKIGTGFHGVDY